MGKSLIENRSQQAFYGSRTRTKCPARSKIAQDLPFARRNVFIAIAKDGRAWRHLATAELQCDHFGAGPNTSEVFKPPNASEFDIV